MHIQYYLYPPLRYFSFSQPSRLPPFQTSSTASLLVLIRCFNLPAPRSQSRSGALPGTLLALTFPAYDHTWSKSAGTNFSDFRSAASLRPVFLREEGALPGLPITGVEEQKVGVANGEAYGVWWIEKGLGDIRF
jgi:hypothetical protein